MLVHLQDEKLEENEKKLVQKTTTLETKIKDLEKKLNEEKNKNLNEKTSETKREENNVSTWSSVVKSRIRRSPSDVVQSHVLPQSQIDQTNFILVENQDRENRKKNVLIFGFKVASNAETKTEVEKVFETIGARKNSINYTRRFRQTDDKKIPPVLAQLSSSQEAAEVLNLAKKRIKFFENNNFNYFFDDIILKNKFLILNKRESTSNVETANEFLSL